MGHGSIPWVGAKERDQVGDDKEFVAPYVRGSDTSKAAAESLSPERLAHLERIVLDQIVKAGTLGRTDKELESLCDLSHESTSARRRRLVQKGLVKDSGLRRKSPSNRDVTIWVLGTEEFVQVGPDQPIRPVLPSRKELAVALEEMRSLVIAKGGSYKPSPELVKLGKWVADRASDATVDT